jgi:hypothetical protein
MQRERGDIFFQRTREDMNGHVKPLKGNQRLAISHAQAAPHLR